MLGLSSGKGRRYQRGGVETDCCVRGGGFTIAGFSVCREVGELMHRDKPDRAPMCVPKADKPIQSQTSLDVVLQCKIERADTCMSFYSKLK